MGGDRHVEEVGIAAGAGVCVCACFSSFRGSARMPCAPLSLCD